MTYCVRPVKPGYAGQFVIIINNNHIYGNTFSICIKSELCYPQNAIPTQYLEESKAKALTLIQIYLPLKDYRGRNLMLTL